jgi:hypothetical protein
MIFPIRRQLPYTLGPSFDFSSVPPGWDYNPASMSQRLPIVRRDRGRSMPWIVVGFAILVGPIDAISIGLVIAQRWARSGGSLLRLAVGDDAP